jgi:hypothetical protein
LLLVFQEAFAGLEGDSADAAGQGVGERGILLETRAGG